MKLSYHILAFCLICICNINDAQSVIDSSIQNGNWSNSTTWKNGRVPHDSDYVVINNYVMLDENVTLSYPGGGAIYVTPKGDLCGPHTLDCEIISYGPVSCDTFFWEGNSFNYSVFIIVYFSQNGTSGHTWTTSPPGSINVGSPISCGPPVSPEAKFQGPSSVCTGSAITFLNESTGNPEPYSWQWSFPGGTPSFSGLENPTVYYYVPGTYLVTLIVTNSAGSDTAYETIHVNPTPTACCDTSISFGQSAQLFASGAVTYSWSPSTWLSCTSCPNPVASPLTTTTYTVTMVSDSGCSATVPLTVDVICGNVFVADAFSPNNDGYNDRLYVRGDCIKTVDFLIFDRWGNKVFESTDKSNGWDGTFKGQPMNTGTYVYYLNATMYDGTTKEKKGNVALVR